jgi:ketosteroid isomerase-like protein
MQEIWDDFRIEPECFFDVGERVLVFVRTSGTGKQSGATVAIPAAHLYTLRNGHVARFQIFLDRHEALRAVGLTA